MFCPRLSLASVHPEVVGNGARRLRRFDAARPAAFAQLQNRGLAHAQAAWRPRSHEPTTCGCSGLARAHLETATAGPRTVPVRSSI